MDREAGDAGPVGLLVLGVRAVVPDERVGHRDDLARVRGVGKDLLVAGHRGIEDDLPEYRSAGTVGLAFEDATVLEHQNRRFRHDLSG
jgi:hypothetical protein